MSDITLITAFFSFNENKYNDDELYKQWMKNLLLNVNKNMVIYTDEKNKDFISSLRKKHENTKIIIMKIEDFHMYKYIDYLNKDLDRDYEKKYHNINLYMIWNEKLNFILKTINENPFNTDYFCWCDIGYVRNPLYISLYLENFPNIKNLTENKIYMLNIDYNFTNDDFIDPYNEKYRYISNIIGGGFIIGHKENLLKMANIYYNEILIDYMKLNKFIGKDQTLYVSLYLKYPDLIKLIKGTNDNHTIPYSELKWFYFLKYLS